MTKQLEMVRRGIRAVLILGLAASTVGNVLHADDNLISQCISAWPVAALYLTIEVIARVPIHRPALARARMAAAAVIAGIAAWVSYWHMAGVASRYGETGSSPYLLPLSVDGLIVVASICLVELGGRIRAADEENGEGNGEAGAEPEHTQRGAASGVQVPSDHGEPGRQSRGAEGGRAPSEEAGQEGVPAGVKLTPRRKRPPTSEPKVVRAHGRYPGESNAQLAKRLNLSEPTVKRHRPKPPDETPVNGHTLPGMVRVPDDEKK
jgi:Protein of unknown function (DUF2637)